VDERLLEEKFGRFGRIESMMVVRDPISKESRGFAFITYSSQADAETAIK
jgi:RNA recognition motif-containing protein